MMEQKTPTLEVCVSGQSTISLSSPAHCLSSGAVVDELGSSGVDGLTRTEAESRLQRVGNNELDHGPRVNPAKILLRQVANAMMLVLILAMAVSFGIRSWIEGGVVGAIIFLNIVRETAELVVLADELNVTTGNRVRAGIFS